MGQTVVGIMVSPDVEKHKKHLLVKKDKIEFTAEECKMAQMGLRDGRKT
jgi:hypothetical protein